ncbi:hypothetical protein ACPOL_5474 [Acidisarcina polymorpha]|uniref:Uncharacterized protein n=1 Tax=Acidisarcina polymorpha TaxID=2211140 RepID=A0A2Z5G668_9BACT|nr:hypothetical protein ACPOL_5474 [Acidisarcina polymorpha]
MLRAFTVSTVMIGCNYFAQTGHAQSTQAPSAIYEGGATP